MTAWSYVALAGIICTTIAVCWGLWLHALYHVEEITTYEYPAQSPDPSEAHTKVWPQEFTGTEEG